MAWDPEKNEYDGSGMWKDGVWVPDPTIETLVIGGIVVIVIVLLILIF